MWDYRGVMITSRLRGFCGCGLTQVAMRGRGCGSRWCPGRWRRTKPHRREPSPAGYRTLSTRSAPSWGGFLAAWCGLGLARRLGRPAGDLVTVTVGDARMVSDVRGRAEPLHDRRFGSILPDIRQNTPKTAITDDPDKGTRGERSPDLRHNPRQPLDQAVPDVPQHRSQPAQPRSAGAGHRQTTQRPNARPNPSSGSHDPDTHQSATTTTPQQSWPTRPTGQLAPATHVA